METRFGRDFSHVRVHTGRRAAASARAIGAHAYTVGRDVVFGRNQYRPHDSTTKSLIAHELVHTIQQGSPTGTTVPQDLAIVSSDHGSEREARTVASDVARGGLARGVETTGDVRIARQSPDAGVPSDAGVRSPGRGQQVECVARLGGCSQALPGGIPSQEDIAQYNRECRDRTNYSGPDVVPSEDECRAVFSGQAIPSTMRRVNVPTHPGWVSVEPTYLLFSFWEPYEFPHLLQVSENFSTNGKRNVTAREGRYKGKDAKIDSSALGPDASPNPAATARFDATKNAFYYGSTGPVDATTDPNNPIPRGRHDIEIPDYRHRSGASYGDFGTTWFRIGHSGDRYLHPGRISAGCATVTETSEWPKIWAYLIKARKDDRSVGTLTVV